MNSSKINYESTVIAFTQINSRTQSLTGYFGFHNCQHMSKSFITIKIKHHYTKSMQKKISSPTKLQNSKTMK